MDGIILYRTIWIIHQLLQLRWIILEINLYDYFCDNCTNVLRLLGVIANISEIQEVTVEHDNVRYFGMSHQVMLHFSPGYSLPLTNNSTFGDCRLRVINSK
ncbi:uncharacterized protein TRIADDRAFT_53709 [Trichoplax adhaerens]|uniref:Uncharacterized protein n=1 Tax=Trichoplax adhaerens TaxID=10228 RepID=B3RPY2_TRIAD|nr:predicted protein [Trichoplax adhaerens]EDV27722.1 predicted protein [Trichoplax adhaerens]|eukprot:XP_002109556.1 predicted protein [Trichoplax adhaerens]